MSGLKELWPHGSTSEGDKGGRGIEGASRSPWGKERSGSGQKLRPQGNAYRNIGTLRPSLATSVLS